MADEKSKKPEESKKTLTDDQVTSERTLGRRSFLTAVGAVVAGGAAALTLGDHLNAAIPGRAQSPDPDKRPADPDKPRDPDKKKMKDPDRTDGDKDKKKRRNPDKRKGDPDKKPDPDKRPDPDSRR